MKNNKRNSTTFSFKQFTIQHDKSSLKVCTDSCLLGAWTNPEKAQKILDIGTGSGLLALMLAQRSVPNAQIDAIDIHIPSVEQAQQNVKSSPFRHQIQVHLAALQDWKPNYKYDYIICNPPFWENSLKRHNEDRNSAMHGTQLTASDILQHAQRLLSPTGILACMYPPAEMESFENKAIENGWNVYQQCQVYDKEGGKLIRILTELKFQTVSPVFLDRIVIKNAEDAYSNRFCSLLQPYYLIF